MATSTVERPAVAPRRVAAQDLSARRRTQTRVRYELLHQLVRKDLKVKYQGSVLGFAWSLANPLILLGSYSFVFGVVLKNGIPQFPIYLMSGLLVWNAFSGAVQTASGSVVGNSNLVKKVRFPLLVLPLSSVGFAGVHFVLQVLVLLVVMVAIGHNFFTLGLLLVIPALLVLVLLAVALSTLVAALNVRYRDTQHFLEVALQAWFWLNPIVYAAGLIRGHLDHHHLFWIYFINPMAGVIAAFQKAFYVTSSVHGVDATGHVSTTYYLVSDSYWTYLEALGYSALAGLVLLGLGVRLFRRMQADFAEEL